MGRLHNPVLRGFHPDPSVCRVGGDYYLACSSFGYFPGVPVFHSRDLASWRLLGHALTRPSQLPLAAGTQGIFAPTLRHHDRRFYLITTNVGNGGNFLVTAENPAGPWSEPVWVDDAWFDPSLLFDADGRVYYTRRGGPESIVQAEIDPDTGRLLGPLREIARGFVSPDCEGPHLYHIGEWYYLLLAEGGSRTGHMATVGRSRSPWGPFDGCPRNPVFTNRNLTNSPVRSVGHADLFDAPDGTWWAACHGTRHDTYETFSLAGRETFIVPVQWDTDGWPVFNKGIPLDLTPVELPWPTEEPRPMRPAPIEFLLPGDDPSARVRGIRITELAERHTARIAVPASGRCGLTLFMDWRHRFDLVVEASGAQARAFTRWRIGDVVASGEPIAFDGHEAEVVLDFSTQRAALSVLNQNPTILGSADPRYLAPEVAGSWTGLIAGLFAEGGAALPEDPLFFRKDRG